MIRPDRLPAMRSEYERRWRSRTPARDVSDVMARNRVTFSDLNDWHFKMYGEWLEAGDRVEIFRSVSTPVLRRLKKEFPDERWK